MLHIMYFVCMYINIYKYLSSCTLINLRKCIITKVNTEISSLQYVLINLWCFYILIVLVYIWNILLLFFTCINIQMSGHPKIAKFLGFSICTTW